MKILLLLSVFFASLFSQTILCYKNNIADANLNINVKLSGDECKGEFSVSDMKNIGWELDDSRIVKNNSSSYNHIYVMKKETKNIYVPKLQKKYIKKLNLNMKSFTINNISANKAMINIGNLIVGQSGIVIHKYKDKNSLIVSNATVDSTSSNSSTLVLLDNKLLEQNALPNTSLKVQEGDTFILNHLYNSSLLIVPNYEVSQKIKNIYPKQNFINPDIFAAHLKINNQPIPTQKDIQEFCKAQDIGTIYIAVENKFYILDVNSFKVLKTTRLNINNSTTQAPFFTKVEDIKKNFWSFWKFEDAKIIDYNNFYLSLINNTTYKPNYVTYQKEIDNDKSIFTKLKNILPW